MTGVDGAAAVNAASTSSPPERSIRTSETTRS